MAALGTVIESLRDDVADVIEAIVPITNTTAHFRRYPDAANTSVDFALAPGKARLFFVRGPRTLGQPLYIGHTTRGWGTKFDLELWYPKTTGWHAAMMNDADMIAYALLASAPTATGVELRHLDYEGEITVVQSEEQAEYHRLMVPMVGIVEAN